MRYQNELSGGTKGHELRTLQLAPPAGVAVLSSQLFAECKREHETYQAPFFVGRGIWQDCIFVWKRSEVEGDDGVGGELSGRGVSRAKFLCRPSLGLQKHIKFLQKKIFVARLNEHSRHDKKRNGQPPSI